MGASATESARAIEMQLAGAARRLGRRASPPPAAKLLLARHARHFAWHAELWDGVVPVLHDRPEGSAVDRADACRRPPRALAAVAEPEGVVRRRAPARWSPPTGRWSGESTPIAERPMMRVLDLVLHDLDFDAQEGHDLLRAGLSPGPPVPTD